MDNIFIYGIFAIIGIIFFLNVITVIINVFTKKKIKKEKVEEVNPLRDEIRTEINEKVKPHLSSLEGMYEKSNSSENTFSAFVLSVFKDKFSNYVEKDEQLLESEMCKCCSDYEGSECKESFCLEGAGISCPKG
jgi:hypothetical protein